MFCLCSKMFNVVKEWLSLGKNIGRVVMGYAALLRAGLCRGTFHLCCLYRSLGITFSYQCIANCTRQKTMCLYKKYIFWEYFNARSWLVLPHHCEPWSAAVLLWIAQF